MQPGRDDCKRRKEVKRKSHVRIQNCLLPVMFAILFGGVSCDRSKQTSASSIGTHVSLIQIIGNPEPFHGKRVVVAGFVVLEFEHHALYLHREDADHLLMKNALWLDLPNDARNVANLPTNSNRRYVIVDGIVNTRSTGHLNLFAATIEDSQIVKVMSAPKGVLGQGEAPQR